MLRTIKFFLTVSLALLLLFTGPIAFSPPDGEHAHLHLSAGPDEARAETQKYTCSMHPFIIRDEPGNCPICGMTLTPIKSTGSGQGAQSREQDSSGAIITIDPVTQQNMGVRFSTVSRRDMSRTIRTVGVVGYEEARQYSINSKIEGWIERLHVNETGSHVKKGQPLLEIYSPELVTAQEEFLLALRNKAALAQSEVPEIAAGAGRLLESSRKRLRYWDISEGQIKNLEKTGTVQKSLTLYSQYDGVLTQKKVNEGMFVKAGMELFQIADISKVWVYADIYEYELPWLKVGQAATIQLPYQQEPVQGRISIIYPYVETKTRTVKARIDLDNPGFELKPDMYVNVRIATQAVTNVLTIPMEAVLNSGEHQTVFVSLGDGKFEPRLVQLGLQGEDGFVQVVQGLAENESIVVSAQFMLDSESTLRAAVRKMTEPEKEQPSGGKAAGPKAGESLDSLFDK
ncbi:MAG: efflux RND transporter periplasmic adaptor subunit [Proteobacteria bacterium]|nr:efflux RND transporter periplasmic adaptor subunit [Desulfocapsa sp.]MBU3946108.1 efflux RND transporter periplasmic adaptor subunit [Pseudomonadota bacterium]MCG2745728.1 efflux RND transporter periplasmic adaptor subunit [Desulfobacteraceae bacterium]MBU4044104.1 efflux RND transporter periplasmic adaptor subunit [Pseudomonadota bacterium]MBU4085751.1 efflux RND transporter periplasmic adaptor subunit [Pseudomonadota bacterium]